MRFRLNSPKIIFECFVYAQNNISENSSALQKTNPELYYCQYMMYLRNFMKKISCFLLILLTACSTLSVQDGCPVISTPREATRQYITNGNYDAFQVILSGNENYCYTDSSTNQRYAVITPIFKIRRLEDSPDNSVDVAFYIKTSGKENYISKRVIPQVLSVPSDKIEQTVRGKSVKVRIAQPPYEQFSLELGLNLSDYAKAKAKSMFDIDYKYFSEEDLFLMAEPEEKILEIAPDETVVYCPSKKEPVVVKKNRASTPCN